MPLRLPAAFPPATVSRVALLNAVANGVIVVTRQVCSVGRRYAGKQVTVQVEPKG